ncbi:sensor domain-containing diguanylate cyclase [Aquabacterium sp. A7-Y]|uniref:sensor domain-containing diguanylate cyclase n=1 Tax=Aquabacterium sp. A7-Y TaxID=1349605 RepID=UPI00223DB307|nr:diguanylate cyclase [Aquabacterium sp. A7-Y]MCW7540468.1 sensor domain-containing diguanylate cyclase [Aquabacterium sp. A7-Y]
MAIRLTRSHAGKPHPAIASLRAALLWLLAWLATVAVSAACAQPVELSASRVGTLLGQELRYLEDPDGRLDLAAVRARADSMRPSEQAVPNFGYTRTTYWFHVRLVNRDPLVTRWLLEAQYPQLDDVSFYALRGDTVVTASRAGRLFPFGQRQVEHRNLIYPLELAEGEAVDIYLRVHTQSSLQLPLLLSTPAALFTRDLKVQLALGLLYGVLVAMLVFNLLAYVQIRHRSYLHYMQFTGSYMFCQLAINGLAFQYLWPDAPRWAATALPVFVCMSLVGMLNFSRSFLDLAHCLPRTDRLMRAYALALLLLALAALVTPYRIAITLATVNAFFVSLGVFAVAVVAVSRGLKQARYFMLAWAAPLVGIGLYPLKTFGLLPSNVLTEYGLQIGSAVEALLLSAALLDRMKILKEQNERIEADARRDLEQRVAQRTEELNGALRELSDANAVLQQMNVLDGLTGVKNRKHFDERLDSELKSQARTGRPLSLLLIDIDHFKSVNDTHGHLAGDACLRAVAGAIAASLFRPGDEVSRYGGEEFAVVLPETPAPGAAALAERIRSAVEQLQLHWEQGERIPLTVSIGVAQAKPGQGAVPLIATADAQLYRAKHEGRNCVRTASGEAGGVVVPLPR